MAQDNFKKPLLESFLKIAFDEVSLPQELTARFNIVERVGHNDFGETYIISDKSTKDLYVLKSQHDFSKISGNEAELLYGLEHKGLPSFEKPLESGETRYFLRRYIEGEPLDEYLSDIPVIDTARMIDALISVCDILVYLHSQPEPIIHRDIKPSNIIIDPESNAVTLIDFGISRKFSENSDYDTTYFGTQKFAPPEQYGFAQTDCRTDIYSLGVVMRYWLTGATDGREKIADKDLEKIAAKCTALAPESRYQNAAALKKALIRYKERGKRRVIALAAGVFCCCAVSPAAYFIGSLIVGNMARSPESLPERPVEAPVVTQPDPVPDTGTQSSADTDVAFIEPLIEHAVRIFLGLDDDAVLSEDDLLQVTALFITYDKAAASFDDWWPYNAYSRGVLDYTGPVHSLEDLIMMPNIERLHIHNQPLTNIEPLSRLTNLRTLELDHVPVTDLYPLEGLTYLADVSFSFGMFVDISPLTRLPNLTRFHVYGCPNINFRQMRDFRSVNDFTILHPDPNTDLYRYLPDVPLVNLNVEESSIDSFEWFSASKPSLRRLFINSTKFSSLNGIEEFTELQILYISDTGIHDLTPLLALPNLREVYMNGAMMVLFDEIRDLADFEVIVY